MCEGTLCKYKIFFTKNIKSICCIITVRNTGFRNAWKGYRQRLSADGAQNPFVVADGDFLKNDVSFREQGLDVGKGRGAVAHYLQGVSGSGFAQHTFGFFHGRRGLQISCINGCHSGKG